MGLGEALNELAPLLHLLLVDAYGLRLRPQAPGEAKGEAVDHRAVPAFDGDVDFEAVTKHDTLKLSVEGADDGSGAAQGLAQASWPAMSEVEKLHWAIVNRPAKHEDLRAGVAGVTVEADLGEIEVGIGFNVEMQYGHGIDSLRWSRGLGRGRIRWCSEDTQVDGK